MSGLIKLRLVLPMVFAFIIVLASISPLFAQPQPTPTCSISVEPQTTEVTVGGTFHVEIWIRNLDQNNPMDAFQFIVTWNPSLMALSGQAVNLQTGWSSAVFGGTDARTNTGLGYFGLQMDTSDPQTYAISSDRKWETLSFRCLGPGSAEIALPSWVWDKDGTTGFGLFVHGISGDYAVSTNVGTVNQRQPAPPEGPNNHVGGEMFTANKLAVLSPYLALFSIVAIAAVLVKRRRT